MVRADGSNHSCRNAGNRANASPRIFAVVQLFVYGKRGGCGGRNGSPVILDRAAGISRHSEGWRGLQLLDRGSGAGEIEGGGIEYPKEGNCRGPASVK